MTVSLSLPPFPSLLPVDDSQDVEHGGHIRVFAAFPLLQLMNCLLAEWNSYLWLTLRGSEGGREEVHIYTS